jgi:hypothetical protein
MGARGRAKFLLLGGSTDATERKRKHIRWALGAAVQAKISEYRYISTLRASTGRQTCWASRRQI